MKENSWGNQEKKGERINICGGAGQQTEVTLATSDGVDVR